MVCQPGFSTQPTFKFSSKNPVSKYPVTAGDSLDAPIVMYDSPDKFNGQKGIHILSIRLSCIMDLAIC